jgi:L-lactate dehydrogenase (cytochrome)
VRSRGYGLSLALRGTEKVNTTRRVLRDNAFARMAAQQLSDDLRNAPATLRKRFTDPGRAARRGSIDELRTAARRALPGPVFDFIEGAAGDEVTLRRNREAFDELQLCPRALRDVSTISLSTTVLGEPIALPIMGAPHGAGLLFHPEAETGIAQALHGARTIYVVSSMASQSIEHLAAQAPGPKWIQMYMWRDRGLTRELIDRASAAGTYSALVLTVDTPRVGPRERDRRNRFTLPPRITLRSLAGGLRHPRWSARFIASPEIGLANLAVGRGGAVDLGQYARAQFDPAMTWDDVEWLRDRWPGPIVLKGILTAQDAALAVRAGVDAISVSNHGGRQLDHAPAAIAALPHVLDAVGDDLEVLVDGGFRRGTDVFKALALGARACLVGRPLIYGLAAAGQPGAARAITLLGDELELTMALMGCANLKDIGPACVAPVRRGAAAPVTDHS